jgi:hypothetical protein
VHLCYPTPCLIEVLDYQSPVASLSRRLTAQQNGTRSENGRIYSVLNTALGHELQKGCFIFAPRKLPLPVAIKQSMSGREKRFVAICSVTQFTEKELKIITLSEAG